MSANALPTCCLEIPFACLCLALLSSTACEPDVVYVEHEGGGASTSTAPPGGGDAAGAAGAAGSWRPGLPPPAPVGGGPGDGPGIVLAIKKLFLGDQGWDGVSSKSAWKQFGYDLDGRISTKESKDLCKPAPGASAPAVYPDGENGIDNAWGKNILPLMLSLSSDMSDQVNTALAAGELSYVVKIDQLGPKPDYDPLVGRWYRARDKGSPAKLDGSDTWPVAAESLSNPQDIDSALVKFAQSYLAANTWVSGTGSFAPGTVAIELPVLGGSVPLVLPLSYGVVTMQIAPDRSGAAQGIIAGIMDTERFVDELRKMAGAFDPGLCKGNAFDGLANQLRQASDILVDGTQDPTKTCSGISVGLGFEAVAAQLGAVATPEPPPPDPCKG
ncbi:MAG: hypothetical protein HY744_15115 [Deltaproteobacteria bacterium]|nr:hypothetical protein [Deltaproteobacteria bacterium]